MLIGITAPGMGHNLPHGVRGVEAVVQSTHGPVVELEISSRAIVAEPIRIVVLDAVGGRLG